MIEILRHLEGAYALIFKSKHYPNELVACKRGSPLLLGVKVSFACAKLQYTKFFDLKSFLPTDCCALVLPDVKESFAYYDLCLLTAVLLVDAHYIGIC